MKRFKVAFRGCKPGDEIPAEWLDDVQKLYPEMIVDDDAPKVKATESPKNKMVFESYRNKKG